MYKPPLIELSVKHFERYPQGLRDTLLHEMIHAWLHVRGEDSGHTPLFKKKMRELGLRSIYHDMGRIPRKSRCPLRYLLRCDHCRVEIPRQRKPARKVSCGRCGPRHYDARFRMRLVELVPRQAGELAAS